VTICGTSDVGEIARSSGSSFYWAMRLLPAARRKAIFAVYAFCREVDDIADDDGASGEKHARLQEWRDEIDCLFSGRPIHPIAPALSDAVRRYGLSKDDFLLVIDGMEMDAKGSVRIADMDALHVYCDLVACAVGRISARIFGLPQDLGDPLAAALGEALQLTNILRDLDEDARVDRVYLPQTLLRAHMVEKSDPLAMLADPAISDVCAEMMTVARQRFDEAAAVLKRCPRRRARPARIMMESHRRVLDRLIQRGWIRLEERVSLSMKQKLWILFRYGLV
jgi:squalene synthase HpnD